MAEETLNNQNPDADNKDLNQEKTFTQAEVNALMAREKDQGRKSILKELGIEDVKTAKEGLEQYKTYLESQKTELQKAQDLASQAAKDKDAIQKELNSTNQQLSVLKLGCKSDKISDVCVLALSRVNDKVSFDDAVALIKKDYPSLFGDSQSFGTGGNVSAKQSRGTNQDSESYGSRLASAHKTIKNPYYD